MTGPRPPKEEEEVVASQTATINTAAMKKAQPPKDPSAEALVASPTDPFFQIFPH
jgi:hypothetical protein